ncbi:MAG: glycoside hydrolase family 5 protein [Thermomicrobiales bacterium]|nr:glycoside hydrolase family 5 protein [Thermomicrobiales bacterium]
MSIKLRRAALILFAAMLLIPAIAACGGGGDDPTATAEPTVAEQASPEATEAVEEATSTTAAEPTTEATATEEAAEATEPAAATETTAATSEPVDAPVAPDDVAYGFNVFAWGNETEIQHNDETIALVQDAGFNWVRLHFYWGAIQRAPDWWDPLPIDNIVDQYAAAGVKILATVSNPPDWARDPSGEQLVGNVADWQNFMFFMADRYKGKVQAWEIWNEQNLASTFGGQVDVGEYANLLQAGYQGVKAADSSALVVFGGLTPTGVNDPTIAIDDVEYLREFYEYQGGSYTEYFDVMGMHANATNNGPDLMYPDNPGTGDWSQDGSFYFRRVEQLHDLMTEYGDTRPAWITEFGWTTANQAAGYEYGADVSEDQQAEYLVRAFEIARTDWADWCEGLFVWNLNFSVVTEPDDEKYPWSVINSDFSPRPAYDALRAMPKP